MQAVKTEVDIWKDESGFSLSTMEDASTPETLGEVLFDPSMRNINGTTESEEDQHMAETLMLMLQDTSRNEIQSNGKSDDSRSVSVSDNEIEQCDRIPCECMPPQRSALSACVRSPSSDLTCEVSSNDLEMFRGNIYSENLFKSKDDVQDVWSILSNNLYYLAANEN